MPRLPHFLLLRAYNKSPLLPLILRGTRDLPSAVNELRWLTEHVQASDPPCPRLARSRLLKLCKRRSRAEPLQYILGSQPFGELEIKCRPGVLIPRPETEAYTSHLAQLLIDGEFDEQLSFSSKETATSPGNKAEKRELRILDICSGSGCISLVLHSLLSKSGKFPNLKTIGLDISPQAISLANENLVLAVQQGHIPFFPSEKPPQSPSLDQALESSSQPQHLKANTPLHRLSTHKKKSARKHEKVRHSGTTETPIHFANHNIFTPLPSYIVDADIIISNPPYISRSSFSSTTSLSVRKYEPRLALVPEKHAYGIQAADQISRITGKGKGEESEIFYVQLLKIYQEKEARVCVMEIGDEEQAMRVVRLALGEKSIRRECKVEIWRDWPGMEAQEGEERSVFVEGRRVTVKGAGCMRAVVLIRGQGWE